MICDMTFCYPANELFDKFVNLRTSVCAKVDICKSYFSSSNSEQQIVTVARES